MTLSGFKEVGGDVCAGIEKGERDGVWVREHPGTPTPALQRAPAPLLSAPLPRLSFPPGITKLWINVGSHVDPPMPPDAETAVLAIEPVLKTAAAIEPHPNLYVVTAAISDTPSFAKFTIFNRGMSSSLAEPVDPNIYWALKDGGYPPFSIVPVLTLDHLIASIPDSIRIELVKTDMQSFDLRAAKSASLESLARVEKYQAEVYW